MTGDVDADAADPDTAAPEAPAPPTALETVVETLRAVTATLDRLGRKLDADGRAEDASVEKVARAAGVLARAAIAVLALDARVGEALAAAASPGEPPCEPTDEAGMDDADERSWADGAGDGEGGAGEAPARAPDPDLAYRLARMAWRLGRGGEVPPVPPERAGEAAGALGLPGP